MREILGWKLDGINIYEIQQMTVEELLSSKQKLKGKVRKKLELISALGLGYLKLSQKIKTLSGGENQRIKLAEALSENKYSMIGLDEPAKGLGKREIVRILDLIYNQISKSGKTFIIAEHNPMFLNYCSYIVELKREGRSSTISFQGSREALFRDTKNDIHNWLIEDIISSS